VSQKTKGIDMKKGIHIAVLGVLLGMSPPGKSGALDRQDRLNQVWQQIEKSEYDIRWLEDEHVYKSANRAQNLRATYLTDGFTVEPRVYNPEFVKPEVTVRLLGVSKSNERGREIVMRGWQATENNGVMDADDISIEYLNDSAGLRQSFWVYTAPAGNRNLSLALNVTSQAVTPQIDDTGNSINFFDVQGNAVLTYSDLNVWDSLQRKLPARMVQNGPDSFVIIVEDSNAVYPILVDPLTSAHPTGGNSWGEYDAYGGSCKFGSVVLLHYLGGTSLFVGAPYYDTASYADAGKVFAYLGTDEIPASATWTKEGDQANGRFGWSLATLNFTGDANFDLAVGAPYYDSGGYTDNGKVWVFSGTGSGFGSSASWSATYASGTAHFGWSLLGGLDINNNLSDEKDLAVGAPDYSYTFTGNGAVFIYQGASSPSTSPAWTTYGNANSAQMGYSISRADFDGDGDQDLLAGCPGEVNYGAGSVATGGVACYTQGASSLSTSASIRFGQNSGDKFGFSVAGIDDQNEDGIDDIVIGAPLYSNGQNQEGKAYLYRGTGTGVDSSSSWSAESNQAGAQMGFSVAGGYIDSDGAADIVVGLPYYDTTLFSKTDNGEAWFYKTDTGTYTPTLETKINVSNNGDHQGWSVSVGLAEEHANGIAIGAPDSTGTNVEGTVTVWVFAP
jgi:hypothetical protein